MLKAWNFTIYKPRHRCFDNNLQKNLRTNIVDGNTADTFDSYFNGRILIKQLTDLNFKKISPLLAARELPPLEF